MGSQTTQSVKISREEIIRILNRYASDVTTGLHGYRDSNVGQWTINREDLPEEEVVKAILL